MPTLHNPISRRLNSAESFVAGFNTGTLTGRELTAREAEEWARSRDLEISVAAFCNGTVDAASGDTFRRDRALESLRSLRDLRGLDVPAPGRRVHHGWLPGDADADARGTFGVGFDS